MKPPPRGLIHQLLRTRGCGTEHEHLVRDVGPYVAMPLFFTAQVKGKWVARPEELCRLGRK